MDYKLVPLQTRQGVILAEAIVDASDYDTLTSHGRWNLGSHGYAVRSMKSESGLWKPLLMHRLIMGLTWGDGLKIDHKDRNILNNQKDNLRIVTQAQNAQNNGGQNWTSPYRGVHWHIRDKKWRAQHKLNGKSYTIGYFNTQEEAAEAARAWRVVNMPYAVD